MTNTVYTEKDWHVFHRAETVGKRLTKGIEEWIPVLKLETTGGDLSKLTAMRIHLKPQDGGSYTIGEGFRLPPEGVTVTVGEVSTPAESRITGPVRVTVWPACDPLMGKPTAKPHSDAVHTPTGIWLHCKEMGTTWRTEDIRTCLELAEVEWVDPRGRRVPAPRLR
jgi:hypothetical protein